MKRTDESPYKELSFADWESQPISLAPFEPVVSHAGMRQMLAGLGDVFLGLSHMWFQADDKIKPPPKKIGEYHQPDYGRDGKGGFERTKDGKKAECNVTVYVEYGAKFNFPFDSCEKISGLQIMALCSHLENEALEKVPKVCESKECPNADVLITYVEWICFMEEIEEEKEGQKEKVKVKRPHIGVRVQVKVTCKS